ncbi:TRAP transporter small permease [Hahella sp. SMD15-11]|uniref:TRAP transporter small permease protein n=1 Tax=Thermohahella caldifontis TaxID=3142973 RepID=A0AB39UTY7_9GAMM
MWIRLVHRFEEGFIALLLVSMTLLVFVETFMRFVMNTGLLWAEELTLTLSAWLVLFGAAYGVRVNAHIGVDAFIRKFPHPLRRFFATLAVVLSLVYCGLFIYGSWIYLAKVKMIGIEMQDLPLPRWIVQSILLIGFCTLALRFAELLWRVVTGRSEGFSFTDEAKESMHLVQKEDDA